MHHLRKNHSKKSFCYWLADLKRPRWWFLDVYLVLHIIIFIGYTAAIVMFFNYFFIKNTKYFNNSLNVEKIPIVFFIAASPDKSSMSSALSHPSKKVLGSEHYVQNKALGWQIRMFTGAMFDGQKLRLTSPAYPCGYPCGYVAATGWLCARVGGARSWRARSGEVSLRHVSCGAACTSDVATRGAPTRLPRPQQKARMTSSNQRYLVAKLEIRSEFRDWFPHDSWPRPI